MKKYLLALTLLAIAIITGCKKTAVESVVTDDLSVTPAVAYNVTDKFVPGELLIKFKTGTSEKSRIQTLAFINGKVSQHLLTNAMQYAGDNDGIYLVKTDTDVFAAIARMKGESEIEYAEPNWIYTHATTTNDTYFTNGQLWGMYSSSSPAGSGDPVNQYGSQANTAWAKGHTGSSNVYVGVIDEGAMYNHVDLADNFGNPNEIAGNNTDDDGNGKVDDVNGWDFVNNDNTTYDAGGDDHGTHVSGTIGGKAGNEVGVAGINWNVKIISAKFLGTSGGTTANAILAVDYLTGLKTNPNVAKRLNIVATNNSWGGGGYSSGLSAAIERANTAGILFIAAAGNGNQGGKAINIDSKPSYPASYTNANVIAVAAINSTGGIASWSNYGKTSVDIGAPGVGIISTVPGGYSSYSGTSMATPHVTGACALYASTYFATKGVYPTAAQIKAAILDVATPTASLSGKCVTGGRLNVSGF
ncbi:MAG: peptidase and in kexin sedolisin [Chitinophagaceae bacterium]|nr:peptidase and in kexin sedolisin [Chitinophagaceae bacterium]